MKTFVACFVILAFVASAAFAGGDSASDQMVGNKTCYYCGIEEPCPIDFSKHKDTTRTIKCFKSCLKFDGYSSTGKRVIVRDCGFYTTTECGNGPYDTRKSAEGSICHCMDDLCNGGLKFTLSAALIAPTLTLMAAAAAVL